MSYTLANRKEDKKYYYGVIDGETGKPKTSFFALQSFCSLFPADTKKLEEAHTCHIWFLDKTRESYVGKAICHLLTAGGSTYAAVWYPQYIMNKFRASRVLLNIWSRRQLFENPVLI
jgi:hypothetical protein